MPAEIPFEVSERIHERAFHQYEHDVVSRSAFEHGYRAAIWEQGVAEPWADPEPWAVVDEPLGVTCRAAHKPTEPAHKVSFAPRTRERWAEDEKRRKEAALILPRVDAVYQHESGEFVYEWVQVQAKPDRYEYRIQGTTMRVREEVLPNYGACYSFQCGSREHEREQFGYGMHPAQVGATRRLYDAWEHWMKHHSELAPLDPMPYVWAEGTRTSSPMDAGPAGSVKTFMPRPEFEQSEAEYLPLDPEPWEDGGIRSKRWKGAYLPVGQFATEFKPREGFNQNRRRYP